MQPLGQWSRRRLATVWCAGLVLQAGHFVLPIWAGKHDVSGLLTGMHAIDARWSVAEHADSLSVTAQRALGPARVTAEGESLYAVVRVPSGRPDRVATRRRSPSTLAPIVRVLNDFSILTALLSLTVVWWLARRDGGGRVAPASPHPT